MTKGYTRDRVAKYASLTRPQLNHLLVLDVIHAEIGDVRKKLSRREADLSVIASCCMTARIDPRHLAGAFDQLRGFIPEQWPEGLQYFPPEQIEEMSKHYANDTLRNSANAKAWIDAFLLMRFERAKAGLADMYLQIAADANDFRWSLSDVPSEPDDIAAWTTINLKRLFAERAL